MRRSNIQFVAVAALAAMALAACSSSSKAASPATSPATTAPAATAPPNTPAATAPAGNVTVAAAPVKDGVVLVNSKGLTLYLSDHDGKGVSNCTGACATAWPPVTVTGTPTYGTGVTASMFSVIMRPDGTKQLAVNGHPLYLWQGDTKPGQETGQGQADFYIVKASTGQKIDND
jgi:predicted lipoprotein with Yx(FWY)xxD motif